MDVADVLRELADKINNSIISKQKIWNGRSEGDWSKFWSSYDALNDAQTAIIEWVDLENPQKLALYGLLQSLVIQQDALRHMQEAMGLDVIHIKNDYPDLESIRIARHNLAGHPSQNEFDTKEYKEGTRTHTTIGYSKDSRVVEYVVSSGKGSERHKLILQDCIDAQKDILIDKIKNIMKEVDKIDGEHKVNFTQSSLSKLLHTADYLASKSYSFERDPEYARLSIDSLGKIYENFKIEICKRYKVSSLDEMIGHEGLTSEIEHIDKILPRVVKMLENRVETDDLDLDVYAESLNSSVRRLKKMAKEIDEEFALETLSD